jgi:hypothetical protein
MHVHVMPKKKKLFRLSSDSGSPPHKDKRKKYFWHQFDA